MMTVADFIRWVQEQVTAGRLRSDAFLLMPDDLPITNLSVGLEGTVLYVSDDPDYEAEQEPDRCSE